MFDTARLTAQIPQNYGSRQPNRTCFVPLSGRQELLLKVPLVDRNFDAEGAVPHFFTVVPFPEEATEVRLLLDEEVIASRQVSPNPPVVEVLTPVAGEVLEDGVEITWDGSDPDGDFEGEVPTTTEAELPIEAGSANGGGGPLPWIATGALVVALVGGALAWWRTRHP